MPRELLLPEDFHDYGWEVEAKGVFWDAGVRNGEHVVPVTFYDPVRLAQDVADDLADRPSFSARRLLVVPRVTVDHMRRAVETAPADFFD